MGNKRTGGQHRMGRHGEARDCCGNTPWHFQYYFLSVLLAPSALSVLARVALSPFCSRTAAAVKMRKSECRSHHADGCPHRFSRRTASTTSGPGAWLYGGWCGFFFLSVLFLGMWFLEKEAGGDLPLFWLHLLARCPPRCYAMSQGRVLLFASAHRSDAAVRAEEGWQKSRVGVDTATLEPAHLHHRHHRCAVLEHHDVNKPWAWQDHTAPTPTTTQVPHGNYCLCILCM